MPFYATRVRSYTEVLGVLTNFATDNPIVSRPSRFDPESGHTFTGTNAGEIFVYVTGAATTGFYRLTCTTAGANGTALYTLARATTLTGTYTSVQTGVATGSRVTITGQNLDIYIDLTTSAVANDTIAFQLIANPLTSANTWTQTRRNTTNDDLVLSRTINSESVFLSFESDALGTNGHLRLTSFDTYNSANSLYAQTNNCPSVYVPLLASSFTVYMFVTARSIKMIFDLTDTFQHCYMGLISTYGSSSQIATPTCVGGMTRSATDTHTSSSTSYTAYWTPGSLNDRAMGTYIKNAQGQWIPIGTSTSDNRLFPYSSLGGNTYRDRLFGSTVSISGIRIEPIIMTVQNSTPDGIYGTFEGVYIYPNSSQSSRDTSGNLLLFANHSRTDNYNFALFDTDL